MEKEQVPVSGFEVNFVPGEVTVTGCNGVLVYEDEVILLRLSQGRLRIDGSGLMLKSYYAGEMQISGRIRGMELCPR
ncbi:MAG: YabP/YqfC family sporulation protein [Clostridia bacterium]|nr:YabP/YqfC family sporulation protein [Clostridia bacterium]